MFKTIINSILGFLFKIIILIPKLLWHFVKWLFNYFILMPKTLFDLFYNLLKLTIIIGATALLILWWSDIKPLFKGNRHKTILEEYRVEKENNPEMINKTVEQDDEQELITSPQEENKNKDSIDSSEHEKIKKLDSYNIDNISATNKYNFYWQTNK